MGSGSSKNSESFEFHPEDYYGDWLEIGRYTDPEEEVCNDVKLTLAPIYNPVGSFRVLRSCGCHLDSSEPCGKLETMNYLRILDTNSYNVVDSNSQIRGQIRVVWTDYKLWSLVADKDRLWIYQRPRIRMTSERLTQLYLLVLKYGYEPGRVILTGETIRNLARIKVYTGTLIAPFCLNSASQKFGQTEVCDKF